MFYRYIFVLLSQNTTHRLHVLMSWKTYPWVADVRGTENIYYKKKQAMAFKCSINYVFSIIKPTLVNGLDEIRTMCYLDVLVHYCLRNSSKSIKLMSQLNNLFGATRIVHCGFIINWEFHCQTNNLQGILRNDKKNNWTTRTIYFCYMSRDNIFRNFIDGILIFTSCVSISYARQRLWICLWNSV